MNRDKNLAIAEKCLPFAFTLHNFEEAWCICQAGPVIRTPWHVNPTQFIIAVSLFTALGFALVFGKKYYPNPGSYLFVMTGFSGALFLNSFFPHILSTLYFRTYMPGVITAALLLLPLTSYILIQISKLRIYTRKQMAGIALLGGIAGIVLIALFLGIGYVFS